jgi:Peptidase family M28/PDZ domain
MRIRVRPLGWVVAWLIFATAICPTMAKEYKPIGPLESIQKGTSESTPELSDLPAPIESLKQIAPARLREHVIWLADDAQKGREAGTQSGDRAAEYLIRQCTAIGLKPAGDNGGWLQPFGDENEYQNVLALVEGSDEKLRDELVILCAHYDHLGMGLKTNSRGPHNEIHNGADDNASGTSAALLIAETLARLGEKPKRSVLIAFWDAEELGMLGSRKWAKSPTVEHSKIVGVVNLDMIGRLREDRLVVLGSRSGYGLRKMVTRQNRPTGLKLDFSWALSDNADHFSFFRHNVPVLMFNTGLHDEYHTPYDDIELINFEGLARVSSLAMRVVYHQANKPETVSFRAEAAAEKPINRPQYNKATKLADHGPPLRVGLFWDTDKAEPGTVVLRDIQVGSPADRAGLKPGDRIYRLDGKTFQNEDQFGEKLSHAAKQIEMLVEREGRLIKTDLDFRPETKLQASKN